LLPRLSLRAESVTPREGMRARRAVLHRDAATALRARIASLVPPKRRGQSGIGCRGAGLGREVTGRFPEWHRRLEQRPAREFQPPRPILAEGGDRGDTVAHTPAERDARGIRGVAYRHGHVAESIAEVDALNEELRVEDEIVRVHQEWDRLEHLAPVAAQPAVKVAQVLSERDVLEDRQPAICDVLPDWHAALERLTPGTDPRAQDHVADPELDEPDKVRNPPAGVLIVRMNHQDDLGGALQCRSVARLLIGPVAAIRAVLDDPQPELACDRDGIVARAVVDQQDVVDA